MFNKKIVYAFFCFFICFLYGCFASKNVAEVSSQTFVESSQVQSDMPEERVNVQHIRLDTVLHSLNLPAKDKILNEKDVFLQELEDLLLNDTYELLILVDKKHFLSSTYQPEDLVDLKTKASYVLNRNGFKLRNVVEKALEKMAADARLDGVTVLVSSTWRSYEYQESLYARNVRELGKAVADRESAAPGTSQHQLGTVIDFGSITDAYAETKAGKWLAANAWKYGFSLSFPDGYEAITGYRWECWHYRYIGEKATQFQRKWFGDIQQYMLEFIDAWKK